MLTGFDERHTPTIDARLEPFVERVLHKISNCPASDLAAKSAEIEKDCGITGSDVRAIVRFLRLSEFEICSDGGGYWFAQYPGDLDGTIKHLDERASAISSVADALRRRRDGMK